MKRRVRCGNVDIGGGAPVSIQSMLNVDTADVPAALAQIEALKEAGCDIVRLAVPDYESACAFGKIREETQARHGDKALPLVADVHFDYRLAVMAINNGADKIRINPGNIGSSEKVNEVVAAAKKRGVPIRVGVNSGSLEKDILEKHGRVTASGLAESALRNAELIEGMGFSDIVVSLKSSDVRMNYDAYKILHEKADYPLHIGLTESGTAESGKVKSAIGIGALLLSGVGDTVRVSFTGDPVKEVLFAKELLEAVGMRDSGLNLISCPTCGRTKVNLETMVAELSEKLAPVIRRREALGKRRVSVAVMGCVVNGPGEAREADLGVACGDGRGAIFEKGEIVANVPEGEIAGELARRISLL